MRIGLAGYADGSDRGRAALALWDELPFHAFLAAYDHRHGIGWFPDLAEDGRLAFSLHGCVKAAVNFVAAVDVVVALWTCVPRNLFDTARAMGRRTALVTRPDVFYGRNMPAVAGCDLVLVRRPWQPAAAFLDTPAAYWTTPAELWAAVSGLA